MRKNSPIFEAGLKANTQAAYDAVGGTSSAAGLLGVTVATLSKYASHAEQWKDNFIRADLAIELDRRSAHPFVLTTMARELGYGLVRLELETAPEVTLCPFSLLKLDRILGEVVDEVSTSLEDGQVDAFERKEIRKRISSAKIALAKLDALMMGGGE